MIKIHISCKLIRTNFFIFTNSNGLTEDEWVNMAIFLRKVAHPCKDKGIEPQVNIYCM